MFLFVLLVTWPSNIVVNMFAIVIVNLVYCVKNAIHFFKIKKRAPTGDSPTLGPKIT